jgi:hypothetical protein
MRSSQRRATATASGSTSPTRGPSRARSPRRWRPTGASIVEPGPLRTDFSGRSLRFAEAPNEAYAPLLGPATAAFKASHGTQPNDPYRGAQAIIAAVEVEHPPLRLPLGSEAFGWLRAYLTGRLDALAAAEVLGRDTAYLD